MTAERGQAGRSWYSDAALAKQAMLEDRPSGDLRWTDLIGIWEPRVPPTADERCKCCGMDAREGAGGNGNVCSLCLGRGHDETAGGDE